MVDTKINFASLFSGIGAPEVALKELGINHKIIFASEIDINAQKTYFANHKPKLFFEDIKKIKKKDTKNIELDLLVFGPPCQSFSIAGNRKGLNDKRGQLFVTALNILHEIKPKYVIIENVAGLQSQNNGHTLKTLIKKMDVEYTVYYKILNSIDCIPQYRRRIYFVLIRKDINKIFRFVRYTHEQKTLKDILDTKVDEKYFATKSFLQKDKVKKIIKDYKKPYIHCITNTISRNGTSREYINYVAAVNYAINQKRKPTPRECARLQCFPNTFVLPSDVCTSNLYQQISNAMCVEILKDIIKKLLVDKYGKD